MLKKKDTGKLHPFFFSQEDFNGSVVQFISANLPRLTAHQIQWTMGKLQQHLNNSYLSHHHLTSSHILALDM